MRIHEAMKPNSKRTARGKPPPLWRRQGVLRERRRAVFDEELRRVGAQEGEVLAKRFGAKIFNPFLIFTDMSNPTQTEFAERAGPGTGPEAVTKRAVCPQCLLGSVVDCDEEGCPGERGMTTLRVAEMTSPEQMLKELYGLALGRVRRLEGLMKEAMETFQVIQTDCGELNAMARGVAVKIAAALKEGENGRLRMADSRGEREHGLCFSRVEWQRQGLPDEGELVLVEIDGDEVDVDFLEEGRWTNLGERESRGTVTAYARLPVGPGTARRDASELAGGTPAATGNGKGGC